MKNKKIIAIDGYSSCGKSTLAKNLANVLHYKYIDSGAMYRAVTLYFIMNSVTIDSIDEVNNALENILLEFRDGKIFMNGLDVSDKLKDMEISENVSLVAANAFVRNKMVDLQRQLAIDNDIIMDGRDIGTTVFPKADLKIFMIADAKVRAERRYNELLNLGKIVSLKEVYENIIHRDNFDTTRKISPLRKAEDAIILDNSFMNHQQQLEFVLSKLS